MSDARALPGCACVDDVEEHKGRSDHAVAAPGGAPAAAEPHFIEPTPCPERGVLHALCEFDAAKAALTMHELNALCCRLCGKPRLADD